MNWNRSPVQIALIPIDESRAASVRRIVERMGWELHAVSTSDTHSTRFERWELTVIAARQVTGEVLGWVTRASAPDQTRVLVVADERSPQVVADVLRSGSDDYLTFPFSGEELAARMQALVLRARNLTERRQHERLNINTEARTISVGAKFVTFSPREWDLLLLLLESGGKPIRRDVLARQLNGNGPADANITTLVSRIRRKLHAAEFEAIGVETIQGQGYLARFRRAADSLAVRRLLPGTQNRSDVEAW